MHAPWKRFAVRRRLALGRAHGPGEYTAFEVWLMRLGVPLGHGRPYHPQTQRKEERYGAGPVGFQEELPVPGYGGDDLVRRIPTTATSPPGPHRQALLARRDVAFRPTAKGEVWNAYVMRFRVAPADVHGDEAHLELSGMSPV